MPKVIKRTAGGLQTNPNYLSEAGESPLLELENCVIDRPGVISKRRGFLKWGSMGSAESYLEFDDRLISDKGSGVLAYDSDGIGTEATYTGTFSAPASGVPIRGVESQDTLYLTTALGVHRTDAITRAPVPAGIPAGLDVQISKAGTGSSWFLEDSQVAYRIIWGRIDANDRLIIGAPSMREVLTNNPKTTGLAFANAAGTITVTHTAHGYGTGDLIEISDSSDTAQVTDGTKTITVTGANTYTFAATGAGAGGTLSDAKRHDVLVSFTVPDDIRDGDFYDIYRTELSANASTDPGDRVKRVIRHTIEQTAVTLAYAAGTVTVTHTAHGYAGITDVVKILDASDALYENGRHIITVTGANTYTYTVAGAPAATGTANVLPMKLAVTDDWDLSLGEDLYTNLQQEGITQANSRPPFAKDIAAYKGYMFYANTRKPHFVEIQLIDIASLVDNTSSVTLTDSEGSRTYTFSSARSLSQNRFYRETTLATTAQNIEATAKNLCRAVNEDPSSRWYAWYISGILDSPGDFVIEKRDLEDDSFSVTCNNATTAAHFSPSIPTTGTDLSSFAAATKNRLYRSKLEQPEAVPDLNFDDVGDSQHEILRILALRNSLLVVTEGGLYRLSGDGERTFTISQLDPTIHARAPRTWVVLENAAYGLCTTGIVRATEASTSLPSWPIDDKINELITYPSYQSLTHAVGYESESKYILWAQETSADTQAAVAWVYNTLTKRWAGPWRQKVKAAHVLFTEDRLYVSHVDATFPTATLRERKEHASDLSDYIDWEVDNTSIAIGTTTFGGSTRSTVTVDAYTYKAPEAGWLYRLHPSSLPYSKILDVENPIPNQYVLTLEDHFPGLTTGTGRFGVAIVQRARWAPETAEVPSAMKHFRAAQLYMEEGTALRNRVGFFSDLMPTETFVGDSEFLTSSTGGVNLRVVVPTTFQRCRGLSLVYENRFAREKADIIHVAYDVRLTGDRTMARTS